MEPAIRVSISSDAQTVTDPATGDATTTPASTVGLTLPYARSASPALVEAPGVVSHDNNNNGSSTVAVLKPDTAVQINTVIRNAAGPTRYSYAPGSERCDERRAG